MKGADKLKKRTIWIIVGVFVVVIGVAGVMFWEYHKQPEFCATCHIMEPYVETWEDSDYEAYVHAQHGVSCLDCHEASVQQQVHELIVFVRGDFSDPLERVVYENEFCFDCHMENQHGSYEEVIRRTSDYIIEGEEINPHDSHADVENGYMGLDLGPFDCQYCHRAHRTSPEFTFCYSCHHEQSFENCRECH